jgi:glycosyltransferase involved in cell wall biosynthesis
MPVYNSSTVWLSRAVASVRSQTYGNWELCIADDASCDATTRELIRQLASEEKRINFVFREKNGHISAASNTALDIASGGWILLLDHDDELAPEALYLLSEAIKRNPDCQLVYSDEDKIDDFGDRSAPYFKSDWNPELFYSHNMFSHLGAYRAELVRRVGGFRMGYEGSQDYDLALRCIERIKPSQIHHIPHVLYHWRIHADSTAHSSNAKPYAIVAGERALNDHFARLGIQAKAESVGYGYRVRYALPAQLPLVSLVIPTRNGGKLLRQCVDSMLAKTTYSAYEIIIVDNGSDERATLRYLESLSADQRIRVLRDPQPFNYSALNNAAVKLARGDVIGLVNDDVEVINPDWLSEMVSHALRPEVGAVGARLWYSDDTLQHAGVVLGIHGIAGHVHRYLPKGNVGYCGRAALIQAFSAVTGACLVVRKAVYDEVGGLDEALAVACNDVDFCLRVREAGYRNIWTPYAELYHHESASRGFDDTPEKQARSAKEVAFMRERWGDALLNDPYYSPNLTLDFEDFSLAWPPRLAPFVQATTLGELAHHEA